jgi:hypothetical protein
VKTTVESRFLINVKVLLYILSDRFKMFIEFFTLVNSTLNAQQKYAPKNRDLLIKSIELLDNYASFTIKEKELSTNDKLSASDKRKLLNKKDLLFRIIIERCKTILLTLNKLSVNTKITNLLVEIQKLQIGLESADDLWAKYYKSF